MALKQVNAKESRGTAGWSILGGNPLRAGAQAAKPGRRRAEELAKLRVALSRQRRIPF